MIINLTTTSAFDALQTKGLIPANCFESAYGGEAACLDLYNAGPDLSILPVTDADYRILIPTGIRVALPANYVGLLLERSSIVKTPLKLRAGVIDPGYTGQIFCNALNFSDTPVVIPSGSKLPFQLLVHTFTNQFNRVSNEEYDYIVQNAKRNDNCIGSTNQ